MKKIISLILFFIFALVSLSAHSGDVITGRFVIENPLSMFYAGKFSNKVDLSTSSLAFCDNDSYYDVTAGLSLASQFFGLGVDLVSDISKKGNAVTTYRHKFMVNFLADYGANGFSVGAKWKLNGTRIKELLDVDATFFRLMEQVFTSHNDNYIEENNSSLSLYAGFYDKKNFSISSYSKDFLILNQSNISFMISSLLDNFGLSVMLKTSEFNSADIKMPVEVVTSFSTEKLLTKEFMFTTALELKFNIAKKTDITLTNLVKISSLSDYDVFLNDSYHALKFEFNVFNIKVSLGSKIPFTTYRAMGTGAVITASLNIARG